MCEIISQGAEAKLFIGDYKGRKCIIKERFQKKYRHPELDAQLTKERMRAESKAISRCVSAGVLVPKLFYMDLNERRIYMEYFDKSITAKKYINEYLATIEDTEKREKLIKKLADRIGAVIGIMHANNLIHGDLTTSNILLDPKDGDEFIDYNLVMIDFGLASYGHNAEQKSVDLYVLERALISTHSSVLNFFETILNSYKANYSNCKETISKFEDVRARGRKRTMIG